MQEEKGSTSGLKRTLSEGSQNDVEAVKREGKRPKVEREELEAQLEFKFTTKAGSHDKLEKVCTYPDTHHVFSSVKVNFPWKPMDTSLLNCAF